MIRGRFVQALQDMKGLIDDKSVPSSSCQCGKLLLAVSGGVDSMTMATLFLAVRDEYPFALAHCNFNLRGEESDGDEALVKAWAEDNDVVCHTVSFQTEAYASEHGISIEMAARELRYGWFARLCIEHGYGAVAVAHNANDNAETLLLNLLRGTGLKGICGMKPVSTLPYVPEGAGSHDIKLVRPLLGLTRKQLEGYAFANKVAYREDSTNSSSDYKRNCIRNEVFPIFERINPSFVRTLNQEMSYFSDASDVVDKWCNDAVAKVVSYPADACSPEILRIDLAALLSSVHWRYLLYHILEPYGFSSQVLASVEDLLSSSRTVPGKRFESASHLLFTGRDCLSLCPAGEYSAAGTAVNQSPVMPVRCAGTYHFGGREFKVEVLPYHAGMSLRQPAGVIVMDADKLKFPFVLRGWRKGDWLVPFGMKGRKKVSDLFADLKFDTFMKDKAVMVVDVQNGDMTDTQRVAAVAGTRIDDRYKVSEETLTIIKITIS